MAAVEQRIREAVGLAQPELSKSAELDVEVDTVAISARLCPAFSLAEEKQENQEEPLPQCKQEEHPPVVPKELQALVDADDSLVQCPGCKNVWEYIGAGDVRDCDVYDAQGKEVVNEEALKAFHENRLRCRQCAATFCKACSAAPFHTGLTCDGHSGAKMHKECRFCRMQLDEPYTAVDVAVEEADSNAVPPMAEEDLERSSIFDRAAVLSVILRRGQAAVPDERPRQPLSQGVCKDVDCQEKATNACSQVLVCGHYCAEVKSHIRCGECLHPDCQVDKSGVCLDDFCSICWVDELRAAPVVRLNCGHVYHADCVTSKLLCKWGAGAIKLGYANCPLCSQPMQWSGSDNSITAPIREAARLRSDLLKRAAVLRESGVVDVPEEVAGRAQAEQDAYVLDKVNFYTCFKCKSAYYGGKVECGVDMPDAPAKDYVCGGCMGCKKHGDADLIYKCKFCCSIATFFCFGNTHFCQPCHDKWTDLVDRNNYAMLKDDAKLKACTPDTCPLGMAHPPNGEEFLIGCKLCFDGVEDVPAELKKPARLNRRAGFVRRRGLARLRFEPDREPDRNPEQRERHFRHVRADDLAARRMQRAQPVAGHVFKAAEPKADPLAALKRKLREKRGIVEPEAAQAAEPAQAAELRQLPEAVELQPQPLEEAQVEVKREQQELPRAAVPAAAEAGVPAFAEAALACQQEEEEEEDLEKKEVKMEEREPRIYDMDIAWSDSTSDSDLSDYDLLEDGDDDLALAVWEEDEDSDDEFVEREFNHLAAVLREKVEAAREEREAEAAAQLQALAAREKAEKAQPALEQHPAAAQAEAWLPEPLPDVPAAPAAPIIKEERAAVAGDDQQAVAALGGPPGDVFEVVPAVVPAAEEAPFPVRVRAARQFWERLAA